jgi:hypothetical protein
METRIGTGIDGDPVTVRPMIRKSGAANKTGSPIRSDSATAPKDDKIARIYTSTGSGLADHQRHATCPAPTVMDHGT